MMRKSFSVILLAVLFSITAAAPAGAGWNPLKKEKAEKQKVDDSEVAEAVAAFKNEDPGMKVFFDEAYGYAIFPSVGVAVFTLPKGGLMYEASIGGQKFSFDRD